MEPTPRGEWVTLLSDLEAFLHDHRPHGPLTGDTTKPAMATC
jgi:hypothetical protein